MNFIMKKRAAKKHSLNSDENYITSVLKEKRIFKPSKEFSENAHIKRFEEYQKMYKQSIKNPEKFWAKQAEQLDWLKKWNRVLRNADGHFKWFEGGRINVSYNCLDRHLESRRYKTALIWE